MLEEPLDDLFSPFRSNNSHSGGAKDAAVASPPLPKQLFDRKENIPTVIPSLPKKKRSFEPDRIPLKELTSDAALHNIEVTIQKLKGEAQKEKPKIIPITAPTESKPTLAYAIETLRAGSPVRVGVEDIIPRTPRRSARIASKTASTPLKQLGSIYFTPDKDSELDTTTKTAATSAPPNFDFFLEKFGSVHLEDGADDLNTELEGAEIFTKTATKREMEAFSLAPSLRTSSIFGSPTINRTKQVMNFDFSSMIAAESFPAPKKSLQQKLAEWEKIVIWEDESLLEQDLTLNQKMSQNSEEQLKKKTRK